MAINNLKRKLSDKQSPWLWVPSLSFADGLPMVAVMTISLIFYKQLGLSNSAITFYTSWMYLPWILKPIWSPFVDLMKTKRWWVLATEILLGAALGGIAFTIPTTFWLQGSLFFFWIVAFAGSWHCVAADGFYMLGLDDGQQALYMGIRQLADRLASIFGQGVLVMVAGNLQVIFRGSISYSWSLAFYGVAGLFIVLWLWHHCVMPRPDSDAPRDTVSVHTVMSGFLLTFHDFFRKKGIVAALLFILLFRLPEALLSKITPLFLIDAGHNGGLGLSPQEFGLVQGTVGVIGVSLGSILGGVMVSRGGLRRWLRPLVRAYALPGLVYVFLSYNLPSSFALVNVAVFVEQFGYGFGLTAFMLFLIYYNRGEFRTSHYAIASALGALSLMLPGLVAGEMQEVMGYRHFFIFVLLSYIVTFIVAEKVRKTVK